MPPPRQTLGQTPRQTLGQTPRQTPRQTPTLLAILHPFSLPESLLPYVLRISTPIRKWPARRFPEAGDQFPDPSATGQQPFQQGLQGAEVAAVPFRRDDLPNRPYSLRGKAFDAAKPRLKTLPAGDLAIDGVLGIDTAKGSVGKLPVPA